MVPRVTWNSSYLDKTQNCEDRADYTTQGYACVVWHGTGGNPDNPEGTLRYNLIRDGKRGSYHVLIDQWGVVWAYLTSQTRVAWHAGVRSTWTLPAWNGPKSVVRKDTTLSGHALNIWAIGIEVDEWNQGYPIPPRQLDACAVVAINYRDRYGIPLLYPYHTTHKLVAPVYKHDPTCVGVEQILGRAWQMLWGDAIPVNWAFGLPSAWRRLYNNGTYLGEATSAETPGRDGSSLQTFQYGALRWKDGAATQVSLSDVGVLTGGNPR